MPGSSGLTGVKTEDGAVSQASVNLQAAGVLVLSGEIDAHSAGPVAEWIERQAALDVRVIDCRAVTYFGAAGLSLLLSVGNGEPLPVLASPTVRRVIEICQLCRRLPIADSPAVYGVTDGQ